MDAELAPSTPQKPKRSRKGVLKSRTGCLTCRIRRLKCDETKPSCKRCTDTQRICDFLNSTNELPWISKKLPVKTLVPSQTLLLRPKPAHSPSGPFAPDEVTHFEFFGDLCTKSILRHFDDTLWNETILQMAHSEASIRTSYQSKSTGTPQVPDNFTTTREARDILDRIIAYAYRLFKPHGVRFRTFPYTPLPHNVNSQLIHVKKLLEEWSSALGKSFLDTENSIKTTGIRILQT
ncbi:hypothetical protein G7Y89_g4104 [Cudoniella acicularis]|uniref:Zn(2)-C6 fungal-type domain-containing protein n=1 Tax=Cudoniella acicularis TaxID=354080 RepID=A0A8H4RT34_9HELO|nr:hypothetical protein G7Y89_g4104 [Cudoniella acicularis]